MNCALKLVNELSLYYDARSEEHKNSIANCIYYLTKKSNQPEDGS